MIDLYTVDRSVQEWDNGFPYAELTRAIEFFDEAREMCSRLDQIPHTDGTSEPMLELWLKGWKHKLPKDTSIYVYDLVHSVKDQRYLDEFLTAAVSKTGQLCEHGEEKVRFEQNFISKLRNVLKWAKEYQREWLISYNNAHKKFYKRFDQEILMHRYPEGGLGGAYREYKPKNCAIFRALSDTALEYFGMTMDFSIPEGRILHELMQSDSEDPLFKIPFRLETFAKASDNTCPVNAAINYKNSPFDLENELYILMKISENLEAMISLLHTFTASVTRGQNRRKQWVDYQMPRLKVAEAQSSGLRTERFTCMLYRRLHSSRGNCVTQIGSTG